MRVVIWIFVVVLLAATVCVVAIPQRDLPETSYNEVDQPLNQAPPVVLGIRFVRPAKVAFILPKKTLEADWHIHVPAEPAISLAPQPHDPHSIQDLLCTLLI